MLPHVRDPDGAIALEAVPAIHLEDVAEARQRLDRRGAIAARVAEVRREVDAGEILAPGRFVVVLDAGSGPHRGQEEIAVAVPVHEEVDVRRAGIAHPAQLV